MKELKMMHTHTQLGKQPESDYKPRYELVDGLDRQIETFFFESTASNWKKKLEQQYGKLRIRRIKK